MKALLNNAELQAELNENGYVTTPFLNAEELEKARNFYREIHPDGEPPQKIDGIHMTTWCSDHAYKLKVADFLSGLYQSPSERFFQNYRRLNNVFIVKDPGETTFKVHQDWNVVDEKENFAINVWVPLYDVTEETGALWVLPKSHQINRHVRGSAYLFPDYSPFYNELEAAAKSVNLKAGEAIVFYLNVIHGSPPNHGKENRIATCFSVIPEDAPLCIYFQKSANDPLEVHEPTDDFMYQYTHLRTETFERAPTENPVRQLASFQNLPVDRNELQPFLGSSRKSWTQRLFSKSR